MLFGLFKKELRCAFRKQVELMNALFFFVLIVMLFPVGSSDPALISQVAPSIIGVAMILSILLSLERLFIDDFHDGSLEQLVLMPHPLPLTVLVKVCCHWLMTGLPLILISPVIALLLNLDISTWLVIVAVLLLATPGLSFIGAVGAALTVNLKKGSILLSLIIIPLYIPTLIFSTFAISFAMQGQTISAYLALLAAMSVGALTVMPFFISAALKMNLQ